MNPARLVIFCSALAVAGCDTDKSDKHGTPSNADTSAPNTDPTDAELVVTHALNETMSTVVDVSWSGPSGTAEIWFGAPNARDRMVQADGGHAALMGLKAGHDVEFQVVVDTGDGEVRSDPQVVAIPAPPADLSPWTVTVLDASRSEVVGNHLILSVFGGGASYAMIIDSDGDYVWYKGNTEEGLKVTRARLAADRQHVLWSEYLASRAEDGGVIHKVALDGSSTLDTLAEEHHHDFVELPDGNFASLTLLEEDWPLEGAQGPIGGDGIREMALGNTDADDNRLVFDYFSDYASDPVWGCPHMANIPDWLPDAHDWTHANSLLYDASDDSYLINARNLDTLTKVDRATGEALWNFGGANNDFTWVGDDEAFAHAHLSHQWDDRLLIFDNGNHRGRPSRVVEYRIDEQAMTAELVWEHEEPNGNSYGFLGDAHRLPGGNTLIAWAPAGVITEVTPEGEVVWRAQTDSSLGRVDAIFDLYE